MEFVPKAKGYSDREEPDEEQEEDIQSVPPAHKLPFCSDSSSSPSTYNLWQGNYEASRSYDMNKLPSLETAIEGNEKLQKVDLSLRIENDTGGEIDGDRSYGHGDCSEREHMFDKVVTPSDVGKLNRLVIPKQHAEKYFPLDSSSNEKGLILNFEDRNGKSWRFRYSYWNSSQSYVMTKGWSRFVKENKLDAGDIVSFRRGVGEIGKHRLFIDWRHRPNAPPHLAALAHLPQTVKWGSRQLIPPSMTAYSSHHYRHFQTPNYYQNRASEYFNGANFESGSLYYLGPSSSYAIGGVQQGGEASPILIDSVPLRHHGKSKPKRLRLFGVNLECPEPEEPITNSHFSSSSSGLRPPF